MKLTTVNQHLVNYYLLLIVIRNITLFSLQSGFQSTNHKSQSKRQEDMCGSNIKKYCKRFSQHTMSHTHFLLKISHTALNPVKQTNALFIIKHAVFQ